MNEGLRASAARVGGHCWVERRLFEVLGAWVPAVADPAAKLALDRHAQHAAWRAEQWWARLPVLAAVPREPLVAAPAGWHSLAAAGGAPAAGAAGAAGGPGEPWPTAVAVAYRVWLPRLAVAYDLHRRAATPVADGPVIRTLGHVSADLATDWLEGEAIVQAAVAAGADPAVLAAAVAAAESGFTDQRR